MDFVEAADGRLQVDVGRSGSDAVDIVGNCCFIGGDQEAGSRREQRRRGVDAATRSHDTDALACNVGWAVPLASNGAGADNDDVGEPTKTQ